MRFFRTAVSNGLQPTFATEVRDTGGLSNEVDPLVILRVPLYGFL
jgi:hypothetical protein